MDAEYEMKRPHSKMIRWSDEEAQAINEARGSTPFARYVRESALLVARYTNELRSTEKRAATEDGDAL